LSVAEIAGVLQCSKAAAKVRLHRARAAFRKQMPVPALSGGQSSGKQNPGRHNSLTQKMGA
jgi:RNA polymerase sigma-70 factor (ECF subfamily)